MLQIEFSVRDGQGVSSGFDLGDIYVAGSATSGSSAGRSPDQGMMIYVAAADLLGGLRKLLEAKHGAFDFVGADSSFSLKFRLRRGRVTTTMLGNEIDESSVPEFAGSVLSASENLMSHARDVLPVDDAARVDLEMALAKFSAVWKPE
jgi:hypothetical protein